jgi:hypothetical protein
MPSEHEVVKLCVSGEKSSFPSYLILYFLSDHLINIPPLSDPTIQMLMGGFLYFKGAPQSMSPPSPSDSSLSLNSGSESGLTEGRLLPGRVGLHTLADAASQSTPLNTPTSAERSLSLTEELPRSPTGSEQFSLRAFTQSLSSQTTTSSRVATTTRTSSSQTATLGPLSQQVSLPPRKQPGRKRATEEPVDKRTAQNRTAQRAYRERRAQVDEEQRKRLTELENETLPQLQTRIAQYEAQARRDQERIRGLVEELEREKGGSGM